MQQKFVKCYIMVLARLSCIDGVIDFNKNIIICISVAISLVTIDTITGDINASISNRPIVKKLNIAAVFGNFY